MAAQVQELVSYAPRHIRVRADRAAMEMRRQTLIEIAREAAPASVRNIYYRAVVAGLVEKTRNGYLKVQRAILELRRDGEIPWNWVVDTGRRVIRPDTNFSARDELSWIAENYRRTPWQLGLIRIEIWTESDSVAGQIKPVGDEYDVPIYPMKGQVSETFVKDAADYYLASRSLRIVVLYAGDFDPAGLEIESQLQAKIATYSGRDDVEFLRLGVTAEQAAAFQALGTKPKKRSWRTASGEEMSFSGQAIECEAMPADRLRALFAQTIEDLAVEAYGYDIFAENKMIELTERSKLQELVAGWSK